MRSARRPLVPYFLALALVGPALGSVESGLDKLGARPLPGQKSFRLADRGSLVAYLPADSAEPSADRLSGCVIVAMRRGESATAGESLLAVGEALAAAPRRRPLLLALVRPDDAGLLASYAGGENGRVVALVDLELVSSTEENRLLVSGLKSSPIWPGLIERSNVSAGFDVRGGNGSELAAALDAVAVPTLSLTAARVDAQRFETFAARVARALVALEQPPSHVAAESRPSRGERKSRRVFTGTIPDYAADVDGLLLEGVIPGGPAEHAGLRGGDVIVEFAGKSVGNIYDYSDALETIVPDEPVEVVFDREGERLRVTITPTIRK